MKNLERTLQFYVDRAIERSGAKSDRKLSEMLGMAPNTISFYRSGRSLPSPDAIIKLALIAGIDPAIAVTDLNIWNTQGDAQAVYKKILKHMTTAAFALIMVISISGSAYASNHSITPVTDNLSIMQTIHYHIRITKLRPVKLA